MTTFDHQDNGTPESVWSNSELNTIETMSVPDSTSRVLVLAAHPDDETLGAGGLMVAAHARGASVTVVIATDGDASHPNSPTLSRTQLAARRRDEVRAAVFELAPGTTVHFLGLPDGQLQQFRDALAAQVEYFARSATHLLCPWEGDQHPDHAACARAGLANAARHGLQCWQYPIWAWHWDEPGENSALPWPQLRRVELSDAEQAAKGRAVQCHHSQHSPLSDRPGDEAILSAAMLEHFARPFETFVVGGVGDATAPAFFDALYEGADDPWGLGTRFYERRKRELLIAALPRERFRRAFEPGCATGLITERLAERCDHVVAWDVAERAITQTRSRVTASSARVEVALGAIPDQWPAGSFDLIVLSEVGYYCPDIDALVRAIDASLSADGTVIACHWRHPAPLHPLSAEGVHEALGERLHRVAHHVEDDFLLDVWTRDGLSVARHTGVLT